MTGQRETILQAGTDNSERPRLNHSCPSPGNQEQRGHRDGAEKGDLMESQRYLGSTSSWASRIRRTTSLYSMQAEIGSK